VDPTLTTAETAAADPPSRDDAPAGATRTPLGQLLVAEGFITDAQLHQALQLGSQTGERLGEVVVRQGLASEEDIARLLADQWGLSYVDRASIWFEANALARLSREDAQRLEAMPTRVHDGRVVVAVAEPTEQRLAALRDVIGEDTVVVVVPKTALEAALQSQLLASDGRAASTAPAPERNEMPSSAAPLPASDEERLDPPVGVDDDLAEAVAREIERPPSSHRRAEPPRAPVVPRVSAPVEATTTRAPPVAGTLAESLAELIEAQVGASRERSAEDAGRFSAFELRLDELESELAKNRTALADLGRHLNAIASLLGKLSAG
jgi:Type II secretion system (T2SS), protein E, N-terminal domain